MKGIFSGLIHDCESAELRTRVYANVHTHKKKRVLLEHAQLDDIRSKIGLTYALRLNTDSSIFPVDILEPERRLRM